ncbi:MAG: hypothetical protein FJ014_01390 [Chloroflexi bacterium]|nr:hypothetical protein [Chloroflexota bacterium]
MDRETITAESLLRDIYEAESALRWFEQKYGLLSETFYRVYQQGQLRDEDPDEIREYMEWSGWYEICQDRRQRYAQAVEQRLRKLDAPASLLDLHISQLRVPA